MRRIAPVLLLFAACHQDPEQPGIRPEVLDRLDAMAGCNTEGSAWPLYQQIYARLQQPAAGTYYACCNVPDSDGWRLLGDWLQQNRDLLPLIERAAQMPHYGESYHPRKDSGGSITTVSLLDTRMLTNLLCAAARETEAGGDLDRALAYCDSAARIGLQIGRRPLYLDRMLGTAIAAIGGREFRRILFAHAGQWSEARLAAFADFPLLREPPRAVQEILRAERMLNGEDVAEEMVRRTEEQSLVEPRNVRAVLALLGYQRRHGRYPQRLDELDVAGDASLRYLPPDGGDGPLLYRVREGQCDPLADGGRPATGDWGTAILPVAPPR